MNEIQGDLFEVAKEGYDAFCITTNGHIKKDGTLTMGRGTAGLAAERFPALPRLLAERIRADGHVLHVVSVTEIEDVSARARMPTPYLVAFPTKPAWGVINYDRLPGWKMPSRIDIIVQSALELVIAIERFKWAKVLLPRPGCDNGGLHWEDVESVLWQIFNSKHVLDRVDIVRRGP